jgi:hypothetical protein
VLVPLSGFSVKDGKVSSESGMPVRAALSKWPAAAVQSAA